MDNLRAILIAPDLSTEERERAYEYFRRWDSLMTALETGTITDIGWGHSCPNLVFVLNRQLEHPERQLLYRIAESLRVAVYYTYQTDSLLQELALLPSMVRVIRIGTDIPDIKDLMGDQPEVTAVKKQVWDYLRNQAKIEEVF